MNNYITLKDIKPLIKKRLTAVIRTNGNYDSLEFHHKSTGTEYNNDMTVFNCENTLNNGQSYTQVFMNSYDLEFLLLMPNDTELTFYIRSNPNQFITEAGLIKIEYCVRLCRHNKNNPNILTHSSDVVLTSVTCKPDNLAYKTDIKSLNLLAA